MGPSPPAGLTTARQSPSHIHLRLTLRLFEVFSGSAELRTLRSNSGEKGVWYEGGNSLSVWTNVAGNSATFSSRATRAPRLQTSGQIQSALTLQMGSSRLRGHQIAMIRADRSSRHMHNVVKELQITYSVDESTNNVQVSHQYVDAQGMPVETLARLMPLQWKRTQLNETEVVATARSAEAL